MKLFFLATVLINNVETQGKFSRRLLFKLRDLGAEIKIKNEDRFTITDLPEKSCIESRMVKSLKDF